MDDKRLEMREALGDLMALVAFVLAAWAATWALAGAAAAGIL